MSIYQYSVQTPKGEEVSLKNFEGKVLLIVNTATGCGFTPHYKDLEAMYEADHDKGLEIYSISQDSKAKDWKEYVEKNEMTWINVLAPVSGKVYKDYGIEIIPRVFLIDCETGEILVHEGQPDLEAILSKLFR